MTIQNNIWEWYNNYHHQAKLSGDKKRQQFGEYLEALTEAQKNNAEPEYMQSLTERGKSLAHRFDEPYWYVLFEAVYCNELIDHLDVENGLKLAVQLVVEIRKPKYHGCPLLILCYDNLIGAYSYFDPVGYAKEIQDAIDFVDQNILIDSYHRSKLAQWQCELNMALEKWHIAKQYAFEYQSRLQSLPAYKSQVWSRTLLIQIAFMLNDYRLMAIQIDSALSILQANPNQMILSTVLLWKATLNLMSNSPRSAKSFYDKAIRAITITQQIQQQTLVALYYYIIKEGRTTRDWIGFRKSFPMGSPYLKCLYHLRTYYMIKNLGWLRQRLWFAQRTSESRFRLLHSIVEKEIPFISALAYLLLIAVFLPYAAIIMVVANPQQKALEQARQSASKMHKPEFYLERVERIRRGEYYVP